MAMATTKFTKEIVQVWGVCKLFKINNLWIASNSTKDSSQMCAFHQTIVIYIEHTNICRQEKYMHIVCTIFKRRYAKPMHSCYVKLMYFHIHIVPWHVASHICTTRIITWLLLLLLILVSYKFAPQMIYNSKFRKLYRYSRLWILKTY